MVLKKNVIQGAIWTNNCIKIFFFRGKELRMELKS